MPENSQSASPAASPTPEPTAFVVEYDNKGQVGSQQEMGASEFSAFVQAFRRQQSAPAAGPRNRPMQRPGPQVQSQFPNSSPPGFSDRHPLSQAQMEALFGRLPKPQIRNTRTNEVQRQRPPRHHQPRDPRVELPIEPASCLNPPRPGETDDAYLRDYNIDPLRPPLAGGLGSSSLIGPTQSTDNALARYDGTSGTVIQNSGVTLQDDNHIIGPTAISMVERSAALPVGSDQGQFWVKDDVPTAPRFTDSTFTDHALMIGSNNLSEITDPVAARDNIGAGTGDGDVVGPLAATDNAVARFDTATGKLIQDSGVTISDLSANLITISTPDAATATSITIAAGAKSTAGAGGAMTVRGGHFVTGNSRGGALNLLSGNGNGTQAGGDIAITGGIGGATAGTGAPITLTGGTAPGSTGGAVALVGGAGTVGGANNLDGGIGSGGTNGAINVGIFNAEAVNIGRAGKLTTVGGGLQVNDLHCTRMTLNNAFTMAAGYAAYMPGPYEIATGITLELGADAVLEIG